jgi:hypothetical protein
MFYFINCRNARKNETVGRPRHRLVDSIKMVLRITGVLDFVHSPGLRNWNTTFRKMGLFPLSGEGMKTPTLLGPLERVNLNHWIPDDGQIPEPQ